jgi:hypothetical protein
VSLERFGLLSLIVWNERTGNIVGGHQRYKVLVESGETETDVVVVDLNDDDEIALNTMLNNPHARGEFTKDVLTLLQRTEVMVGNAFAELRLDDLHSRMKRVRWEKPEPRERSQDTSEDDQDPSGDLNPPDYDLPEDSGEPDAIIVCPECESIFRMTDDKVVYDGTERKPESLGDTDSFTV